MVINFFVLFGWAVVFAERILRLNNLLILKKCRKLSEFRQPLSLHLFDVKPFLFCLFRMYITWSRSYTLRVSHFTRRRFKPFLVATQHALLFGT